MKVFIDGSAGTTGLRLASRLAERPGVQRLSLPEEARHDPAQRREALNNCDVAFLCLPDAAAIQAADMVVDPRVTVIDTSTAHRTAGGWVYGFPELRRKLREGLKPGARIAVPGCHASGFIALIAPLVDAGLLPKDALLSCFSLTGYSGGGKKMIADYEAAGRDQALDAPRQYGLGQSHKHLPEMQALCGLVQPPIFSPVVADYYSGMAVTVPLFPSQLRQSADLAAVKAVYREKYQGPVVRWVEDCQEDGFLTANALSGKDSMEITVAGSEARMLLIARYDNLGKGASGAALQCLNLVTGADETTGLVL